MRKTTLSIAIAGAFFAFAAHAEPFSLSEGQMDAVTAGGAPTPTGFVCPVIKTDAVLNAKNGGKLGIEGYYTVGGPEVAVPVHATNGDGSGTPGGPFSKPGDTDYTAIWYFQ